MNELIKQLRAVLELPSAGCSCGQCKMLREANILLGKLEAKANEQP
jgi:hypothetical protein